MLTPQDYAEHRARISEEALREKDPGARVTHEWKGASFYRFACVTSGQLIYVEFDPQEDIAPIGQSDEKWISKFLLKVESQLVH